MGRLLVGFWVVISNFLFVLLKWGVQSFELEYISRENYSSDAVSFLNAAYGYGVSAAAVPPANALMVGLTLVQGAAAKGAVCLDGTQPGYHLHRGFATGARSWLVNLEGGGWCNSNRSCIYRKSTRRGSSNLFEKAIQFSGILSNKSEENPDFFNWNRVKIRYCDGASFAGDSENKRKTHMASCNRRLDVKRNAQCRPMNADVSGGYTLRNLFAGVINLHRCSKVPATHLHRSSRSNFSKSNINLVEAESLAKIHRSLKDDTTSHRPFPTGRCFFPQNLIANITTPLFILNAAYDAWQIQESLAPHTADPKGKWHNCRINNAQCLSSQRSFLKGFRNQMLSAVGGFSGSRKNGLFLNSCFAHCQSEGRDVWFGHDSPTINNKSIAVAVGDWYFDRAGTNMAIGCDTCNRTCHNLIFK
ncbi:hypothetical protein OROHE_018429 [Orobanche hederae]